jgi:hypothetical protein
MTQIIVIGICSVAVGILCASLLVAASDLLLEPK